jgi:uncharacterized protein YbaR (Trm112 family)
MPPEQPAPTIPWSLDAELRAILVCPACRGDLHDLPAGLHCPACALIYPVVDDIPQLISEEARPYASAD